MRAHHHHQLSLVHLKHLQPPHHRAEGKRKRRKNRSGAATKLLIRERNRRDQRKSSRESSMVSRDNNQHSISPVLREKLQLLRSITHSTAVNESSIILDASKYIEELKEKVEILNQDITTSACSLKSSNTHDSLPTVYIKYFFLVYCVIMFPGLSAISFGVTVETLEKGFLINVISEKSCPGLLVSVLEAFEQLNLNVAEATASCTDSFRLEAFSSTDQGEEQGENVNAQVVRQAVLRAIRHWSTITANQDD
ncbi:hypothetical protein Cgig2_003684 [Carnegiea gigantea]|uniref:Plant bHLH transcription factor ACT-like domain-containing protein n=1 Tax=Carnegiea gigantea TaxID=171969 RepID=A0A9Q1KFL1_9CARY|nr:hypothetical protein Cgig2_003684 [Carnegiea gigantea]